LDVSMPGADKTHVPATMDASAVPDGTELIQLSRNDSERLEFNTSLDVLMMPIARQQGTPRWLIVVDSAVEARNNTRLSLYARLLDNWVGQLLAQSASRITVALAFQLLPVQERIDKTVANALDELTSAMGVSAAAIVVTLANGMEWLRVGSHELFGSLRGEADAGRLVVVKRAPQKCTTALAVARSNEQPFTRAAEGDLQVAADVFHSWALGILGRAGEKPERRARKRGFADLLDALADRALAEGTPVTAAVLSAADARFRPTGVIQAWVAELRSHLRPQDLAGILTEGEIGVLLHDATAEQAQVVMVRLRDSIAGPSGQPVALSVGLASRAPQGDRTGSLIDAARADALPPQPPAAGGEIDEFND
jgi:hypothetical protein